MSVRIPVRYLVAVVLLAVAVACIKRFPNPIPGDVLYAVSVPATKTLVWTERPAAENVTSYTVTCDAQTNLGAPTQVLPTACTSGTCSRAVTLNAFGSHSCSVFATNTDLSGGAGVVGSPQNSPVVPLPFTLNQEAGSPAGFGVK